MISDTNISMAQKRMSRKLSTFAGDTSAYCKYNFGGNTNLFAQYKNQPLKLFFQNMEVPIKAFSIHLTDDNRIMFMRFYLTNTNQKHNHHFTAVFGIEANEAIPLSIFKKLSADFAQISDKNIIPWKNSYSRLFESVIVQYISYTDEY